MREKKFFIITLCLLAILIPLVSASVRVTYPLSPLIILNNDTPSQVIEFRNDNASQSPTVTISLSAPISPVAELSSNSLVVHSFNSVHLQIKEDAATGTYVGELVWVADTGDNGTIPVVVEIEEKETTGQCRLIELPHTTSYRIKQGETTTSAPIKIKVSTECPTLSMSVAEETHMSKPMFLHGQSGDVTPGGEFSFTIGLDATGIPTGQYQNTYIVSGYSGDHVYEKRITLSTIVVAGESPITNETFASFPTCTLESDMQLNQTYSLICNNENPNIDIVPQYNDFFQGVSVSESEGKFEYIIKPLKLGNTVFRALFTYKGTPVGEPFEKEVRITQGNTPLQGTTLSVIFYQNEERKEITDLVPGETTILVKDSNTDSIVPEYTAYLNGKEINNTFQLEADKYYELIVSAPGYLSSNINFSVVLLPEINVTLIPSENFVEGSPIGINIEQENCTIFLDGKKELSTTIYPKKGEHSIEIICRGYANKIINITVKEQISIISNSTWKKGLEQVFVLNYPANWTVLYSKDLYSDKVKLNEGVGEKIIFTPKKAGIYQIIANGISVATYDLEGFSCKKIFKKWWFWVIIVLIVGGGLYVFFVRRKEEMELGLSSGGFNVEEK